MVWAGILVILIGLGIAAFQVFQIPGYWMPLMVGVVLLVVGAWRAQTGRQPWHRT
jgi:hypothetical protein